MNPRTVAYERLAFARHDAAGRGGDVLLDALHRHMAECALEAVLHPEVRDACEQAVHLLRDRYQRLAAMRARRLVALARQRDRDLWWPSIVIDDPDDAEVYVDWGGAA